MGKSVNFGFSQLLILPALSLVLRISISVYFIFLNPQISISVHNFSNVYILHVILSILLYDFFISICIFIHASSNIHIAWFGNPLA